MLKTNLDSLFKTNTSFETDGIWLEINEKTAFRVRRFGGLNSTRMKAAMAKFYKPYARQVETGTLGAEKEREITCKVFVHSCLVDWKGVEIDGQECPFDADKAVELFLTLPDLMDTLVSYASDNKNYKEDLGNF